MAKQIDWKIRSETLSDPEISDGVKRAMMRFWLAADRYDQEEADKSEARPLQSPAS
jgi:hypothetical protein